MKSSNILPERPGKVAVVAKPASEEPLYEGLHLIEELIPFFDSSPGLRPMDCEDMANTLTRRVEGLLQMLSAARLGELSELGDANYELFAGAIDGVALHVQLLRLVTQNALRMIDGEKFTPRHR